MDWNGNIFPLVYAGCFFGIVLLLAIISGRYFGDD